MWNIDFRLMKMWANIYILETNGAISKVRVPRKRKSVLQTLLNSFSSSE